MQDELIDQACLCLLREGFALKTFSRCAFDVIARKENRILFLKLLEDANALDPHAAEELHRVSGFIKATPLIIAHHAGGILEDRVVYSRYGIYTMTLSTFKDCLVMKPPFLLSTTAGITAELSPQRLTKALDESGMSRSSLSRKIGVSKAMINRYEHGGARITVSHAVKFYTIFGSSVFSSIDPLSNKPLTVEIKKTPVTMKFEELGFLASETPRAPMDVIARKDHEIIFTELGDLGGHAFQALAQLVEADSLVIFDKKKPKDVASISKKEFMALDKGDELVEIVREF